MLDRTKTRSSARASGFFPSVLPEPLFDRDSFCTHQIAHFIVELLSRLAILDYVHMEEWYWRGGGYARCSGAMGQILEKTLVCNEQTRQVLIRDFGRAPESVETLYIGVDSEKYDAALVEPGQARARLGLDGDRPIILYPCRIHAQKRPFLMLEIARRLTCV